jgi:hypothetical protein
MGNSPVISSEGSETSSAIGAVSSNIKWQSLRALPQYLIFSCPANHAIDQSLSCASMGQGEILVQYSSPPAHSTSPTFRLHFGSSKMLKTLNEKNLPELALPYLTSAFQCRDLVNLVKEYTRDTILVVEKHGAFPSCDISTLTDFLIDAEGELASLLREIDCAKIMIRNVLDTLSQDMEIQCIRTPSWAVIPSETNPLLDMCVVSRRHHSCFLVTPGGRVSFRCTCSKPIAEELSLFSDIPGNPHHSGNSDTSSSGGRCPYTNVHTEMQARHFVELVHDIHADVMRWNTTNKTGRRK